MDRVRGAIFSSLGELVPGAKVLDLFAGAGGMGIEALSRGSESATFVDLNPKSVAVTKENLRRAKLTGIVQTMDALKFVELYGSSGFDLIFADPPYAKWPGDRDFATELLQMPALKAALNPGGLVVMERYRRRQEPEGVVLTLSKVRKYGESEVAYYHGDA
jgi:16S rRNA (guanine966-N2)-methyltransferase